VPPWRTSSVIGRGTFNQALLDLYRKNCGGRLHDAYVHTAQSSTCGRPDRALDRLSFGASAARFDTKLSGHRNSDKRRRRTRPLCRNRSERRARRLVVGSRRVGCSSRSTGPGVFPGEQATLSRSSAGSTTVAFRLGTHSNTRIDVRLILERGQMREINTGSQVSVQPRSNLDIPEMPPRGGQFAR
jgi:hypothetical protein